MGSETEVVAQAQRRRFTAEDKRRIVREADRYTTTGAIGALLRRDGLYSSYLTAWRAARDRGAERSHWAMPLAARRSSRGLGEGGPRRLPTVRGTGSSHTR